MIAMTGCVVWTLLVLGSLNGWGAIVNRLLLPVQPRSWALRAAWGIAFSTCAGGLLNLAGALSSVVVIAYLAVGFLVAIGFLLHERTEHRRRLAESILYFKNDAFLTLLGAVAVGLTAFHLLGWASVTDFNPGDDCMAYLCFPLKMLRNGSLGSDPFNERRIVTSLGGCYFINLFALSAMSLEHINLMDIGIGFILTAAILIDFCRDFGMPARLQMAAIVLVLIQSLVQIKLNLTSTIIPVALLLALFVEIYKRSSVFGNSYRHAISLGLLVGGLCSLKSTFFPICGVILAVCLASEFVMGSNRRALVLQSILCVAVINVVLVPWMIALHQSNGTYLFPLLGKGFHRSAFNDAPLAYFDPTLQRFLDVVVDVVFDIRTLGLLVIVAIAAIKGGADVARTRMGRILGAAASLSFIAGDITFGDGLHGWRYMFPVYFATLSFFSLLAVSVTPPSAAQCSRSSLITWGPAGITLLILVYFVSLNGSLLLFTARRYVQNIEAGVHGAHAFSAEEIQRARAIQDSVPPGEILIANTRFPVLMNFRRNPIYILDWPGGSSLPPGMPLRHDASALLRYFQGVHLRYIAVAYLRLADADVPDVGGTIPFQRIAGVHSSAFHASLKDLLSTRKKVFDDGDTVVLDLDLPP